MHTTYTMEWFTIKCINISFYHSNPHKILYHGHRVGYCTVEYIPQNIVQCTCFGAIMDIMPQLAFINSNFSFINPKLHPMPQDLRICVYSEIVLLLYNI